MAVAIPLALTGCDSDDGPTAAQAGQTLKNHILQLLKERDARDVTITDPGGQNIPCGDGKAKQTFAATGRGFPQTEPDDQIGALVGALKRVAQYEIVDPGGSGKPVRMRNTTTRTSLVLGSPANGLYSVSGETQCLMAV
ncbi:hypothetical protein [Planotetraspora mira]|uniref:hypothetical protein n=1 Tax=Planotetraspora mira TaxID=58121 RepID=UPI0019509320|nr:hypothetical protein [Planotetraspora mira]